MNENCPLCNSINTNKSREGFTFKKNAGENYLKSIKNYRHELLEKKINFYICRDCGTGWRDDSNFSKKIDEIYHKQHSLHWKSFLVFRELVIGNISSSHLISMEKLVN